VIVGFTAGVYDMFHVGHRNLLRAARGLCDRLIVAVSTDELVEETKGKVPIIPFQERLEMVQESKYVDLALPQSSMDKVEAWHRLNFDVMFVGDDWYGSETWNTLERHLKPMGVRFVYLPYTRHVSSSILRVAVEDRAT
jgi:glycerol-3-phosphate cytidylyltransferase